MDNKQQYSRRTLSILVYKDGSPIYDAASTKVSIIDKGAGEIVEVSQNDAKPGFNDDIQKILICPDEWEQLKQAIDEMIQRCN